MDSKEAGMLRVSRAILTRQNQIKSAFMACRVRIAWKSCEYDHRLTICG